MKKALIAGLIVGIVLSFAQIFIVRTTLTKNGYFLGEENCDALTAECGYCPGLKEGNICYTDGVYQRYRGFPLVSKSGGGANSLKLGVSLYLNMLILIIVTPIVFLIAYKIFRRKKKRTNRIDTPTSDIVDDGV
jgi:hypothetical protein